MRIRPLLILTALVSSILGALVVYLVLTVPNDLQADALLKRARQELAAGNHEKAQDSLSRIVQQYPRTDAAAAATVALAKIAQQDRAQLQKEVTRLRQADDQQAKVIGDLQRSVETIRTAPPRTVTVQAPAPKTSTRKATPKKTTRKTTPKRTTKKRRR